MNRPPLDWHRMVARVAIAPPEPPSCPPPDLAGRVLAAWQTLRRDEQVRRWARWSLRGALLSVFISILAIVLSRHDEPPILLTPPETPFFTPQFSAP